MDDSRLQKDVLRFEIAVDEPRFLQNRQSVEQLGREDLDELRAETLELVLLDQLVQVGREEFEDETQVVLVDE